MKGKIRVGRIDFEQWPCRGCGNVTPWYTRANEDHTVHTPVAFGRSEALRGDEYRYFPAQEDDMELQPPTGTLDELNYLHGLAVAAALAKGPDVLVRASREGWAVEYDGHSLDGAVYHNARGARIAARRWLQAESERRGIAGAIMCGRNR